MIVKETGGQDGVRDNNMLESALATPLQTFDSKDLYPNIVDKFSRLSFGLVMDHPFYDGNKRIGLYALTIGLKYNEICLQLDEDETIKEFLDLASGKISYDSFASWVRSKIV